MAVSREEKIRRLKASLQRIAAEADVESLARGLPSGDESSGFEALGSSADPESGLKKVLAGREDLTDGELLGLEAIVLPQGRPAAFLGEDGYGALADPWTHLNANAVRDRIRPGFAAIGRVELPTSPRIPYGGTGFVVGDGLLMTNRHVARLFIDGVGSRRLVYRAGDAAVHFRRYRDDPDDDRAGSVEVKGVAMIHPYWDMALLRIDGPPGVRPLTLSVEPPQALVGRDVAAVGYPARDERNDLVVQDRIFERVYGVKRFQPGKVRPREEIQSFETRVSALTHDSSTLGGNSGSALIDVATGHVVGLHFAGVYLKSNYAVPSYELARDPRVVAAGVNFAGPVPPTGDFDDAWRRAEGVEDTARRGPATPDQTTVARPDLKTATWTFPIQISVTVGSPTLAPATRAVQAGIPGVERAAGYLPSPLEGRFDAAALAADPPGWGGHLTAALASHLAYADKETVEQTARARWGMETCEFLEVNATRCFIASAPGLVLIAFRGTVDAVNWLANLDVRGKPRAYGTVHRGFYYAFADVQPLLERRLDDFPGVPIVLTGHSLGGALATIAAAEWEQGAAARTVHTFGQPAAVTGDVRNYLRNRYRDSYFRFVNDDDIVPRVPPGYVHVGRLFHLDAAGEFRRVPRSLSEAVSESGTETMSEPEFRALQARLRAVHPVPLPTPGSHEAALLSLEGFLPSVSDHSMNRYIEKLQRHAP